MPYSLRGSNNRVLPKARTNVYVIDIIKFVGQKVSDCQEKSKSPNHWRFLKDILSLSKPLTAAVNRVYNFISKLGYL